MAVFNPNVPALDPGNIPSPNTYLGYSKGTSQTPTDSSAGELLKNVGDVIEMGVKGADRIVKDNIQKDIYNEVDTERGGFTEGLEYISGQKKLPKGSPADLEGLSAQASNLQTALGSGKISPTYYHQRLNTLAKTLRSQYPGYREYIDNQISNITGVNPANAYITSLMADINRNNEKKDSSVALATRLLSQDEMIGVPGAAERLITLQNKQTPEVVAEIISFASKNMAYKADDVRRQAEHRRYTDDRSRGSNMAQDDIITYASREASGLADSIMYEVTKGEKRSITDIVAQANTGGVMPSPEQSREMARSVKQARDVMFNRLWAKANAVIPGTNHTLVSRYGKSDDAKKLINDQLTGVDMLYEALSNNQYGLAAAYTQRISDMQDKARLGLYTDPDMANYAMTATILNKDMGPNVAEKFFRDMLVDESKIDAKFVNYVKDSKRKLLAQPDLSNNPQTGKPVTVKDVIEEFKVKDIKDQASYTNIVGMVDKLADVNTPLETKQKLATAYFHPSARGLMANFSPRDTDESGRKVPSGLQRSTVFTKLTSPTVTAEMKKLGGDHWNNYVNWVEHEFGQSTLSEVNRLNTVQLPVFDGVKAKIGWDGPNSQFVLDVNGTNYMTKNVEAVPPGIRPETWYANLPNLKTAQNSIFQINSQLGTVKNVAKESGKDVDAHVFNVLKNLGLSGAPLKEMMDAMTNQRAVKKPNG